MRSRDCTLTTNPVEITQADIDAWERFGPAIFYGEMTGPQALAAHRLATRPAIPEDVLNRLTVEISDLAMEHLDIDDDDPKLALFGQAVGAMLNERRTP